MATSRNLDFSRTPSTSFSSSLGNLRPSSSSASSSSSTSVPLPSTPRPHSSTMKGALLVSVETIRSRLQALSDATAPTPRSKAKPKESEPSDLDMMLQYYGGTLPSTLRYNAPPPSYDALYGPDPNKPVSKREAMKAIAKTVARELVGGK